MGVILWAIWSLQYLMVAKNFHVYPLFILFVFLRCPLAPQCGVLRDTFVFSCLAPWFWIAEVWRDMACVSESILHFFTQNNSCLIQIPNPFIQFLLYNQTSHFLNFAFIRMPEIHGGNISLAHLKYSWSHLLIFFPHLNQRLNFLLIGSLFYSLAHLNYLWSP